MSAAQASGGMPDLSALIGTLLANPAAMSMLSSLLANRGDGTKGAGVPPPQKEEAKGEAVAAALMPPAPPPKSYPEKAIGEGERAALLSALRPFLPPEKCDMIDGLLRILDLLAIIRKRR